MYNATILRNKEANMYTSFSNLENIVGEYGNDMGRGQNQMSGRKEEMMANCLENLDLYQSDSLTLCFDSQANPVIVKQQKFFQKSEDSNFYDSLSMFVMNVPMEKILDQSI